MMHPVTTGTERDVVIAMLKSHVQAVLDAGYGLTDEQLLEAPCRSELSVGGLMKHAAWGLMRWGVSLRGEVPELTGETFREFEQSTVVGEGVRSWPVMPVMRTLSASSSTAPQRGRWRLRRRAGRATISSSPSNPPPRQPSQGFGAVLRWR